MQPAGKNILPIFNKKKRPRQAVFTFPQKAAGSTDATAVGPGQVQSRPQQSYQPPPTQQTQSQSAGYMQAKPQQKNQLFKNDAGGFKNNPMRNTTNSSVNNSHSSFSAQPSRACGPTSQPGFLGQPSPKVRKPPNKQVPMQRQPQQFQPHQQQQQYQPQQANQMRNNQPRYQSRNGNENHQQYGPVSQQSNRFNKPIPAASTYQTPGSQSNKRSYTPFSATQTHPMEPGPSTQRSINYTPNARPTFTPKANSNATFNKPTVFIPFQGSGSSGTEVVPPVPETPAPVDKSLKILASSIEGMKHWSQYTDFVGFMMFEMFGVLSSAVTTGESETSKFFTLKDGLHAQKCVFYETDRKIPRLTRGQCLRCVGNLDKKSGLFRVVTVRPASQQEQSMSQAITAKCDQAIGDRLAEMQEQ